MADQVQYRRGTTAENEAFTGAEGELTVDTSKDTLIVHDGVKAGGSPLAREDLSNVQVFGIGRNGVVPAPTSSDVNRALYGDGTWRVVSGGGGGGGKSAYETAVDNGYVGTEEEWLLTLVGPTGPQGTTGAQGPQGLDGPIGPTGPVATTTLRTVSTTTYTLILADAERMIITDNAGAKTLTVPTNASVAMPYTVNGATTSIAVLNTGAGILTLAPASGVTFVKKTVQALTVQQFGIVVLTKIGTDSWYLSGDLDS